MLIDLLNSVLTSLSILFAVYVFWWGRETEKFNELRRSLFYIRNNYDRLKLATKQQSLAEIGFCISDQIRKIYSNNGSKDDLIELLKSESYHNYIITALDLGLKKSSVKQEIKEILENIQTIPQRHEADLPLISHILDNTLYYLNNAIRLIASEEGFGNTFANVNYRNQREFLSRLESLHDIDLVYRELAEILREICYNNAEALISIFESSYVIAEIVGTRLVKMSDQELFFLKLKDNRIYAKIISESEAKFPEIPIDKAYFYLEHIKSIFKGSEWHRIKEARETIINEVEKQS